MKLVGGDVMLPADPQRMLGGYAIRLIGLTGDAEMLRLQTPYTLALAVAAGTLPHEARFTMFHLGPAQAREFKNRRPSGSFFRWQRSIAWG